MIAKGSFCLTSIKPFFANSNEATKLDEIEDLLTILFNPSLGIKFIKFVHSFKEPKIPFKRFIAWETEYNSEELIVNWLIFSFLKRMEEYDFNKSYKVAVYVIFYLMLIPSVEPP